MSDSGQLSGRQLFYLRLSSLWAGVLLVVVHSITGIDSTLTLVTLVLVGFAIGVNLLGTKRGGQDTA